MFYIIFLHVYFMSETGFSVSEVRTHGVGFYKFDAEEERRQQQMDQLSQLRDQVSQDDLEFVQ